MAFLSIVFIKAEKHFWVRLRECIAWSRSEIESQIGLSLKFTADNFADLRRNEPRMIFELEMLTWRLWLAPPKYQNSFCKVAPHPFWVSVPSPYSKAKSSLILPQMKWIFRKTLLNLPLKSTMNGLLENLVHDTRTAFPVGKVVVGGTVAVVTSGADVVSIHSNSLQGQPAEQFSWIWN